MSRRCRNRKSSSSPSPKSYRRSFRKFSRKRNRAIAEIKAEPHGNSGKTPWYMKEIAQTREEKRQERSAREAANSAPLILQAIIERMQADPKPCRRLRGQPRRQRRQPRNFRLR